MAPFHDEDQDGIYDPDQGDYPWIDPINKDVPPDQLLWTMFHSDAPNLIAEFGITSYVYYCQKMIFFTTQFSIPLVLVTKMKLLATYQKHI